MTVLRSREVVSTINRKGMSKTMENGVLEPSTPAKNLEFLNQQSNSSPPNVSPSGGSLDPKKFGPGSGSQSTPASVTGPARRQSLRLAAKLSAELNGNVENVHVSSQKRSFHSEEEEDFDGCSSGNLKSESVSDDDNRVLHFGMKKVRLSEQDGAEVDNIGNNAELPVKKVVSVSNEDKLYDDVVSSGQSEEEVEDEKKVKGKRKLGVELGLLGSETKENENKFLSLRSGKRISRIGFGGKCLSFGAEIAGDESSGGDGEVQGAESRIMRNDENFKGVESNESKTNVNATGSIKPRSKLTREEKAKGKLVENMDGTMEMKVDVLNADEVLETLHLAETVDVKAVDEDLAEFGSQTSVTTRARLSRADKGKEKLAEAVDVKAVDNDLAEFGSQTGVTTRARLSRADKGKEKLAEAVDVKAVDKGLAEFGSQTGATTRARLSRADKGKEKLADDDNLVDNDLAEFGSQTGVTTRARLSRADKGKEKLAEAVDVKAVDKGLAEFGSQTGATTRARLSRADKGKEKLADDDNLMELKSFSNAADSAETSALQEREQITEINVTVNTEKRGYRERFRDLAKRNASRFAHFSSQEEENPVEVALGEASPSEMDRAIEDWPGPFSTAMKIIKDRGVNMKMPRHNACLGKNKDLSVIWVPKNGQQLNCQRQCQWQFIPTLQELCWPVLVKNADAITSLDCVPDMIKHKLSQLLCDSRRMNSHFLELLVCGSPAEIRVWECSWLTEEMFMRIFEGCDTRNLMVLQLDQCGCCLPDYILSGTLARSPNSLPALTTISLKGAYRLSDVGLSVLVSSAPSLRSINLSQCSLLTSDGISSLADSLGSILRELYIDDCQGIDAMLILPALLKLQNLEVLSLAGIQTVCDNFVNKFVTACGHSLKELVLKDCVGLTDSSVKVIAETCSGLCAIDLSNLSKLTDAAIGYLANGCHSIQRLKLCRNLFSDEAIAAYLETCGNSLKELSLNHVGKVADDTALSLAKCSKDLVTLDLSWCRNLSNEALGLIVDSCLSLKVLKLFGCTQITNVFVNGHSNPQVQIIGLKMTAVLNHLKEPDFIRGPLRYSSAF